MGLALYFKFVEIGLYLFNVTVCVYVSYGDSHLVGYGTLLCFASNIYFSFVHTSFKILYIQWLSSCCSNDFSLKQNLRLKKLCNCVMLLFHGRSDQHQWQFRPGNDRILKYIFIPDRFGETFFDSKTYYFSSDCTKVWYSYNMFVLFIVSLFSIFLIQIINSYN